MEYKWNLSPIGKINKLIDIDHNILKLMYFDQNLSVREIAKQLKCSKATISKKLMLCGFRKRKSQFDPFMVEAIRELCDGQCSMSGIAKKLGCGRGTVEHIVGSFGFSRAKSVNRSSWKGRIE
jgi:biotin operon repressor